MKALFLLLLLANFFYAGWRFWIVPAAAPPAFVEAQDVARLELLELPDDDIGVTANRSDAPAALHGADRTGDAAALAGELAVAPLDADATGTAAPQEPVVEPAAAADIVTGQTATPGAADAGAAGPDADDPSPSSLDDEPVPAPPQLAAVSGAPARCVSLGPFLNLRGATEATAMLNEIGLRPSQRLAESQVWFGHWVFLPEQPSRAVAIEIVESLREQGISDIYIEPSGPFRNHISLGVFTDAAHAETRAGQIRRLGVSPQIRDRYRDSSVYWVDFALPAGSDIDPSAYQSSPSRVLRLETRDCPPESAGQAG